MSSGSASCSSASSSSKTRSAEATPDWSRFIIEATWVSGWVNWRLYWMKACTSPSEIAPLATRIPPSTAITTYWRFPMNIMIGMIRPLTNWAVNEAR